MGVNIYVANYKCYVKGRGDEMSSCRRTVLTIVYKLHLSKTTRTFRTDVNFLILVFDPSVSCLCFTTGNTWKPAV